MASLSEMIAYADWKRSQQLPDPTVISGLNSIAGAIRNVGAEKKQNRMLQIMGGKPGFSWEMEDGKVKYKYDPNAGKKKTQVFNVGGGKLVKYNPDDESTDIVFDANKETDTLVEPVETPKKIYDPNNVDSWEKVPVLSRLISAFTPSATPEEQQLGGLRFGGVFNPPKVKKGSSAPAPKVNNVDTATEDNTSDIVYFKNKKTGGKEPFRKVNGKWVRITQ